MRISKIVAALALLGALGACSGGEKTATGQGPTFALTFPSSLVTSAQDGRVILLLSGDFKREPKDHVEANLPLDAPFMFGVNVEGWATRRLAGPRASSQACRAAITRCRWS
jgi:hypothetical protein